MPETGVCVIMLKKFLEAGQIVSTHGINGEVRVMPWCDSPEFLAQFDRLYFKQGAESRVVELARPHKSLLLVKFEGVDGIDEAMKLLKSIIYIDRDEVELPEGSYFEQDIIGLEVIDAQTGKSYGRLSSVGRTGANDVYGVRAEGGAEVLIPAIKDVISAVDIEGGRMLITPLKGLFEDED
jgi:16S rRNA processing protein RimM